jgi:tetratricopeptide (TPR) repeat protein
VAPALLNVKAQIALDSGDATEAVRLAQVAADTARSRGNHAEQANALRNAGRARLANGEAAASIILFEQALAIDLVELARAAAAAGDRDGARGYLERAQTVSHAARDPRGMEEMEVQLKLR